MLEFHIGCILIVKINARFNSFIFENIDSIFYFDFYFVNKLINYVLIEIKRIGIERA